MGLDVARIDTPTLETTPRASRDSRAPAAGSPRDAADVSSSDIPAGPPPEVLDAIGAAGRVARELHAQGRELRFVAPSEHDGVDGRVRIELRDLDGHMLRTLRPSEALDVANGAPPAEA